MSRYHKQWLLSNSIILSCSEVKSELIQMGVGKAIKPLSVNGFLGGTTHEQETGTTFQHMRKTYYPVLVLHIKTQVEFPGFELV